MAGIISENTASRSFTLGLQVSRERVFDVHGTEDEEEVRTLLLAATGASYLGLALDTINCEAQGGGLWKCHANYVRLVDDSEYTFDTGGGTQKITQSLATINSYAPAGLTPPDFQGAIGVSEDRVDGADVVTPQYVCTETHLVSDVAILAGYKTILFGLTGKMNDASFKGFAAGECLFLGAAGSRRADTQWSITYHFAGSPNVTGATIGTITGVDKLGWDYLWVRYADYEDTSAFFLVKRPAACYVERVYLPDDFSTLAIGT